MASSIDKPTSLAIRIAGGLLLAGAGAGTGYFLAIQSRENHLPWDDVFAMFMGVLLIATGVGLIFTLATRPQNVPEGCGTLQIIVMILAGALYFMPVISPDSLPAEGVLAGLLAVLAIQTVANVMLWNRADEMLRRVMVETAALAFVVCQLAYFLYAASERLGLVSEVSPWGLTSVLMVIYLLASIVAGARLGLK